MIIGMKGCVSM